MDSFNILIVDDEQEWVDNYRELCEQFPRAKVLTASDQAAARTLITDNFFHLALVDLDFNGEAIGLDILAYLADFRPTCKCVLITRRPSEHQSNLLELLDPLRPLTKAIVDKRSWRPVLRQYVAEEIDNWTRRPIDVGSIPEVIKAIQAKNLRTEVAITPDEIDYLLSFVHGQGMYPDSTDFEVSALSLNPMSGGRSTSVVLKCQPSTSQNLHGIWTVLKLSPREDAIEEYLRYSLYVRFLVSLDARVEVLGHAMGDTLGVICYSFAGKSPHFVQGLNDLFDHEDERSAIVLNKLFDPEAQCWYSTSGKEIAIPDFLERAYTLKTAEIMKTVSDTIQKAQARVPGVQLKDGGLVWNGIKLNDPSQTLGSAKMSKKHKSCIIHGDMNAHNIITGEDGRAIMIDYRHTTVGPRSLDFAALETAVRLSATRPDTTAEEILKCYHQEVSTWKNGWKGTTNRFPQVEKGLSYWQTVSTQLLGLARMNFSDLTPIEYACACFGWITRMFKVRMPYNQRLRLLCWMAQLSTVIEDASKGRP